MQQVDVIDELLKGLTIGILVSAPMGPVGILTVQRTLNKGRWEGFATGMGASASDLLYAIITGYGMHMVVDIIENPAIALIIKIVGSFLLLLFGVYTFRSKPKQSVEDDGGWANKRLQNDAVSMSISELIKSRKWKSAWQLMRPYSISGFTVTVVNPLIIFLFVALFGQFTFIIVDNFIPQLCGYVGIVMGALLWWWSLTSLIDKVRAQFNNNVLMWINRVIGTIVMVVSTLMIVYTVTGHAIPFSS